MYAYEHESRKQKNHNLPRIFPIQRAPITYYIHGTTHLVQATDSHSLFNGKEDVFLQHNTQIIIDNEDSILSRRGPNQEIPENRAADARSTPGYLWYRVTQIDGSSCLEKRVYVRADALSHAPTEGSIISPLPSLSHEAGERLTIPLPVSARSANRVARGYNTYDSRRGDTPHVAIMSLGGHLYVAGNSGDNFSICDTPLLLPQLHYVLLEGEPKEYNSLIKHNTFVANFPSNLAKNDRLLIKEFPQNINLPETGQKWYEDLMEFKEIYTVLQYNINVMNTITEVLREQAAPSSTKAINNTKRIICATMFTVKLYLKLAVQAQEKYHPEVSSPLMNSITELLKPSMDMTAESSDYPAADTTSKTDASPQDSTPIVSVPSLTLVSYTKGTNTKYISTEKPFPAHTPQIYHESTFTHQHGEMLLLDKLYFEAKAQEKPGQKRQRIRQLFVGGSLLDCIFCHWAHALFNKHVGVYIGIEIVTSGTHGSVPPSEWRVPIWMREKQKALDEMKSRVQSLEPKWEFIENDYLFHLDKKQNPSSPNTNLLEPAPSDSEPDIFWE